MLYSLLLLFTEGINCGLDFKKALKDSEDQQLVKIPGFATGGCHSEQCTGRSNSLDACASLYAIRYGLCLWYVQPVSEADDLMSVRHYSCQGNLSSPASCFALAHARAHVSLLCCWKAQ